MSVTVQSANLTRNLDHFTKMDPVAIMEFRNLEDYWEKSSFTTKALDSAGKTPVWNETFDFYLKLDD